MTRGLFIAIALGLLAGAARAEDRAAPARQLVREALAARALGPVAPPVLPVLVPGSQGEPRPGSETPPHSPPSPGSHPKPTGTPAPPAPGTTAPPSGHSMSHTTRSEAVGPGAHEAHRIRADAANRAAVGATANGASTSTSHAGEECHDAAGAMRTMGMDPEHTDATHHGGMMPDPGGTMPGHH
jgi:hypothetical protein